VFAVRCREGFFDENVAQRRELFGERLVVLIFFRMKPGIFQTKNVAV
jgi:hypothetical protein